MGSVEPRGAAVLLWRRADSPVEDSMIKGFSGFTGRYGSLFSEIFLERWHAFPGTKEPVVTITLFHPSA